MKDEWTNAMGERVTITNSGDLRVQGSASVPRQMMQARNVQTEDEEAFAPVVPYHAVQSKAPSSVPAHRVMSAGTDEEVDMEPVPHFRHSNK